MRQTTPLNASRVAKRTLLGLLIIVFVGATNVAFAERNARSRSSGSSGGNHASYSGSGQAVPRSSSGSGGSRSSSGSHAGGSHSGGSHSGGSHSGSSTHRRTGTSRHHGGGGYYPPYYGGGGYYRYPRYGLSLGFGYGFYGYPLYGYWPAYSYSYYPRYGGYVVADAGHSGQPVALGALELKVKPKKAQVFVDGRYIGLVKNFDGFPSYLWLQRGSYELTFYQAGYQNLVRRIDVIPGNVIELRDRLQPGVAELPEGRIDVHEPAPARERPARRAATGDAESDITDLRSEPASLDLSVSPAEASVYLDGRFLGSGQELSNLRAPLIIDSGEHVLQVVHPDFATERREFTAESGERVTLDVELR